MKCPPEHTFTVSQMILTFEKSQVDESSVATHQLALTLSLRLPGKNKNKVKRAATQ